MVSQSLRSRQKRKTKAIVDEETSGKERTDVKGKWSEEEVKSILEGLDKYGLTRIEAISSMLPYKTTDQVKQWLWRMGREAYKMKQMEREAESSQVKGRNILEKMSVTAALVTNERGKKLSTCKPLSAISKTLLLLGNMEEHPTQRGPEDIDFKHLYTALYMSIKGYPLPKMNNATLKFFIESFETVLKTANSSPIESFPVDDSQHIERLAESQVFNPLSFNVDLLKAIVDSKGHHSLPKIKDWLSPLDWSLL